MTQYHGGFHGVCFQTKAVRISYLPLNPWFNKTGLDFLSSIIVTETKPEIIMMDEKEKTLTINPPYMKLFLMKEKNKR